MFRLWKDRSGAIAIYSAFVGTLLIGAAVVGVDYGRMAVLRSQMQNAADSAAMGAAAQLDGLPGARARASAVAMSATQQSSNISMGGGALTVQSPVEFFSAISPVEVAAIGDADAEFVRVTIVPENIRLIFQPVIELLSQSGGGAQKQMHARATATQTSIVCDRPHIMICNPDETGLDDITDAATMGRQIKMADGTNDPDPGQFKIMCPPINNADTDAGMCGSLQMLVGLIAQNYNDCTTGTIAVTGSPVTSSVLENGVNSRFGTGSSPIPAPNVMTYPDDATFASNILGDGSWDPATYWPANHGGALLPPDLVNATRYQTYLYELGESYAANGKQTIFPAPATLPPGFTVIAPGAADIPAGGVPPGSPFPDPKRRILKAAVVQCDALGLNGNSNVNIGDMRMVDVFVTSPASGGGPIMGELVSPMNAYNSSGLVSNVRLVK